jgi:flagellar basal-body rod modification protein FlgD
MATSPISNFNFTNGASGANSNSTTATTGSDQMGKQEFLRILMMQLKNQDPMNPMQDRDFIAQMAQLSTLEATNGLSSHVQAMVAVQQQTQALQMVGHDVEYTNAEGVATTGKVAGVRVDSLPPMLVIGDKEVPVTAVTKVV